MDEFGICPLCPTPRGGIEFVRKDAHGNGDGNAFDIEKTDFAKPLPIETAAGNRRVRQPCDRDVVEDVVARESLRLPVKDTRNELIAARIVIKEISREADGRVCDSV